MSEEIWKDIEGYEGRYQVSTKGNVRCVKRYYRDRSKKLYCKICEKHLKGNLNTSGYPSVRLYSIDNKSWYVPIHILVANAFLEKQEGKDQVDHINRDRTDNRVENLRRVNRSENMRNKKDNVCITHNGFTKTATEWSILTGIKSSTITNRYKNGWTSKEILEMPICKNGYDAERLRKTICI